MSVITYSKTPIRAVYDAQATTYYVPSVSMSISAQNKLEKSTILAPNQNNNFRIGGELNSKISISFIACNQNKLGGGASDTWNFASGVLQDLTGLNSVSLYIGANLFSGCYLDDVSVEIAAFKPVMITADFTCLTAPVATSFSGSGANYQDNLVDGIAYGFNTVITDGSTLSDSNRESISYKINCDRSYTTSIGRDSVNNVFLNQVQKQLTIKSHNIGSYISFSGYGEAITIDPQNASGQSIVNGGFGMSSNCKIVAQNLSTQQGDILMGDVSLQEVVL